MVKGFKEKGKLKAAEMTPTSSQEGPGEREKLGFLSYLIICGVFAAICGLQILVIRIFSHETKGMAFFFGSLIFVFGIVAVYTWIYDTFSEESPKSTGENP